MTQNSVRILLAAAILGFLTPAEVALGQASRPDSEEASSVPEAIPISPGLLIARLEFPDRPMARFEVIISEGAFIRIFDERMPTVQEYGLATRFPREKDPFFLAKLFQIEQGGVATFISKTSSALHEAKTFPPSPTSTTLSAPRIIFSALEYKAGAPYSPRIPDGVIFELTPEQERQYRERLASLCCVTCDEITVCGEIVFSDCASCGTGGGRIVK